MKLEIYIEVNRELQQAFRQWKEDMIAGMYYDKNEDKKFDADILNEITSKNPDEWSSDVKNDLKDFLSMLAGFNCYDGMTASGFELLK